MERLTEWDGEHAYNKKCFEECNCEMMSTDKCNLCEHDQAVYRKLAAYEDAGLTPIQVTAMQFENEWLKAGNAHLQTAVFKIATHDGGIPCEWCDFGKDDTDCMCRVCQDNEFKLFECGGLEAHHE